MKKYPERYPCLIGGEKYWPSEKNCLEVKNPADGSVIGYVPQTGANTIGRAVRVAREAFSKWKNTSLDKRGLYVKRLAAKIKENVARLSVLLSQEVGKPIRDAKSEVLSSAELLEYLAEVGLSIKGEIPVSRVPRKMVTVTREPVGVVGSITPFNYPLSTLACKLGSALVAGCTVVSKPDEHTPLSTIVAGQLAIEVGFPPGVFNVITGAGETTGALLVEHPGVDLVTFTGSFETGTLILEKSAKYVRKVILELGGNCPAIICKGSCWKKELNKIIRQTFKNSGQYCYRINRIYVQDDIFEEFLEEFLEHTSKLTLGFPNDPATDLGPLNNEKVLKKVEEHVLDATKKNGELKCGGERILTPPFHRGIYFPPTVITNVNHEMLLMQEETFGPVVGISPVASPEEGVKLANESLFGLAAYLFCPDGALAVKLARNLEAGSVWINDIHQAYFSVPFGGVKRSGLGREKSLYGIEEFTELKTTYIDLP